MTWISFQQWRRFCLTYLCSSCRLIIVQTCAGIHPCNKLVCKIDCHITMEWIYSRSHLLFSLFLLHPHKNWITCVYREYSDNAKSRTLHWHVEDVGDTSFTFMFLVGFMGRCLEVMYPSRCSESWNTVFYSPERCPTTGSSPMFFRIRYVYYVINIREMFP